MDIENVGLENTNAIAVRKRNNSAGIVPAVFKSVLNVSKKTNGESAMALPGSVRIVNGSCASDESCVLLILPMVFLLDLS